MQNSFIQKIIQQEVLSQPKYQNYLPSPRVEEYNAWAYHCKLTNIKNGHSFWLDINLNPGETLVQKIGYVSRERFPI